MKNPLNERLKELAGIKPLYELDRDGDGEVDDTPNPDKDPKKKEYKKGDFINLSTFFNNIKCADGICRGKVLKKLIIKADDGSSWNMGVDNEFSWNDSDGVPMSDKTNK